MLAKRKICVITGTRAEYGLLRCLMTKLKYSDAFLLQIIVTGMHLSDKFGNTYKEIEDDGFIIDSKVDIQLTSDSAVGISRSTALGLLGFSEALDKLAPDLILVLGDRFEILSAVVAAMFAKIPVAHIHGGERTEGCIDEAIRHSVTKCSHLHFVAHEEYRNRVIQLGESPKHVFQVGGLGVDAIKKLALLTREELEKSLSIKFLERNLLITYHPVTLEKDSSSVQIDVLLEALSTLENTLLIFTMPNADADNSIIYQAIEDFVKTHKNAHAFKSLGQLRYFSCISYVDAVIGNSSSGLTEVPSFKKPTINIGDRQKGRLHADSVINCASNISAIKNALSKIYKKDFQRLLKRVENPYGNGDASDKIIKILESSNFTGLLKKQFNDLRV